MNGPQTLLLATELRTDPDFLELRDDMAEAIRTLLFEGNDGWEDRLVEIISDHLVAMDLEPTEGNNIEVGTSIANTQLKILLQSAVTEMFRKGDWL